MNPPNIAIGGVFGAKHYCPALDIVSAPRLDISVHSPKSRLELDFIEALDPALKRVDDPLIPAHVAVHATQHADSLFRDRSVGLHWADPVDCFFDLREARLDAQANQLFRVLQNRRPL